MKKLLITSLILSVLNATDDLESLLNKYEKESDLSKQTKIESLGHVVIFSRRDLDRMQFDTLSELLKYVKLTSFGKTRFGTNALTELGYSSVFPSSIRLYLNDMDLSYTQTDSPFFNYANISLTHIDHIEIYLGAASLKLGDYPSAIVVKLYTKKPEREDSLIFKTTYGSYGNVLLDAFVAKKIDKDNDYLILLNRSNKRDKDITIHNQNVSNNSNQKNVYVNYRYKNSHFELSYIGLDSTPFMGLSRDDAPDYVEMENREYYFMYRYEKDYKLNLSYTNNNRVYEEKNRASDGGLLLPMLSGTPTYLNEDRDTSKLNFALSKKFQLDNNSFFSAISFQNRKNNLNKFDYVANGKKYNGKDKLNIDSVKNYSIAVEDNYNFNERTLLFSSFKYDIYKGSGDYQDANNYIARIGLISIPNENIKMKGFLTKSYLPVTILEQEFAKNSLKQTDGKEATFETIYNFEKNKFGFLIGWSEAKNAIIFDENAVAKNLDKKMIVKFLSLSYKRELNLNSKFDLVYSRTFFNENFSSQESIIGKFISTINNKIDFFTGVVYNSSYQALGVDVDSSVDVDVGAIYHLNKLVSFKLKGKNIFNDSSKSVYKTPFESGSYDNDIKSYSVSIEVGF